MTTPNHLHTLPYHPPNITHHMNSDWMRPFEDRSKETPKRRKRDPNQRFRLVFCREVCCFKCYGWLPTDIVIPCESIHRFFFHYLLSTNFSVMAHPPYAPRDFESLFSTYDSGMQRQDTMGEIECPMSKRGEKLERQSGREL